MASPEAVQEVHASLAAINAGAEVIHTLHACLDLARILNRGAFNPSQTPEDVSYLSLQLCGAQVSSQTDALEGATPGHQGPSECSNRGDAGSEAGPGIGTRQPQASPGNAADQQSTGHYHKAGSYPQDDDNGMSLLQAGALALRQDVSI